MELKALKPRLHNIMFHTHTVSGIVISFALFICFYAGAVALFMDEIYRWENPNARFDTPEQIDYDKVLEAVKIDNPTLDISKRFSMVTPNKTNPFIWFSGNISTENGKTKRISTRIHPISYEVATYDEPQTHMARTIYELHYFRQIPVIGMYLSGFVAFFFLFAIITGLLTHWKNIVNKFYAFTVKGKWKQIWTNGHTTLGIIALPFQLIYAITGALLGLSILLLAPSAFLLFDGDTNEIVKTIRPDAGIKYDDNAEYVTNGVTINSLYDKVTNAYPENKVFFLRANNYGKEDGTISFRIDNKMGITGDGILIYKYKDGSIIDEIIPDEKSYAKGTYGVLIKLHYATFGGIFLKIIYFILAMITCYIIISGVMIWRTARDNKKYTDKQRKFHHRVTKVYLAITLSFFPAVALIFIANKLVPINIMDRIVYVNSTFFLGWLFLTIAGLFWNDYRKLNKNYLVIGSILGLIIPVLNGIITGDWIWKTLANKQYYVFSVDVVWLFTGIIGILISLFYLKNKEEKNNTSKESNILNKSFIELQKV